MSLHIALCFQVFYTSSDVFRFFSSTIRRPNYASFGMTVSATALFVFLLAMMSQAALAEDKADKTSCSRRCDRLFERSLERIKMHVMVIEAALKARRPIEQQKDVCWKFEDFEDCHTQCEHPTSTFFSSEAMRKTLWRKCRPMIKKEESHFKCISKYHSFLEIRCSTYAKEATSLRRKSKGHDRYRQETCRFLHYHNRCLSNNILQYCPNSMDLFNRFTLREFFLSFVVPQNDELFSDSFLDFCQIFDFAKMAQDIYDSTSTARSDETTSGSSEEASTERPKLTSRLFSPYEDLADSPPNFHYSSQRSHHFTQTTRPYRVFGNASEIHHYDREDTTQTPHMEVEFITHPVTVHFELDEETTTHPSSGSEAKDAEDPLSFFPDESGDQNASHPDSPAATTSPSLTLDANQILSTIMKFPGIFPTAPMKGANGGAESSPSDDVHREIAEILAGIDVEETSVQRPPATTPQAATVGFGRPYLRGTKVHIKPIWRWNEPDTASEEEGTIGTEDGELVIFSSSEDDLQLENGTVTTSRNASVSAGPTTAHIRTMLTIYAILFATAFLSLACLVLFLIIRSRCRPRGKYVVQ
ncbi:hypothetical protein QR680_008676 [Steinernema hermaphroditum]|uniref:Uncharacterized protein n=1 Tax=Steinernema hermaphroditum TaxID=289476 RepID=A0AA39IHH8_9BILA|nr:hypothetical protein QR680_008676 [Steinernema hermaphroditum]